MGTALSLDGLASGLSGFGHPIRIRALALMLDGEITPREVAEALGEPLGVVSYHIRMMVGYELVVCTRTEPRRGALAHYYVCTPLAEKLFAALEPFMKLPRSKRFKRPTSVAA